MTSPSPSRAEHADAVTLRSSRWRVASASAGAAALVLFALWLGATNGWSVGHVVLLVVAILLVLVVLLDMPLSATFSDEGITRRTPLRRQFIPWSRVHRLYRTRQGSHRLRYVASNGSLVASVGGRPYLLIDRTETYDEFNELINRFGDSVGVNGLDERLRPRYGDERG